MRRLRISELAAGFLLGFASLLIVFLLSSDIAAHYEVCETTKEGANECARYGLIHFALHEIGSFLDSYNGLITAIATGFIAWFTLSLRQSTDKLWDAGERQIELARENSAAQSSDMQASIREALRAASAMENVAQGIAISAQAAQDSVATLRERTAIQMRAYLTVLIGGGTFQERGKNLKFEVKPTVINSGHTPAHNVTYRANAAVFDSPLPADVVLSDPDDVLNSAFVLGPQQNIILNAIVDGFFDEERTESIKRGIAERVYIWGTVSYEDAFGERHETKFCHNIYWILNDGKELIFGNYASRHNEAT